MTLTKNKTSGKLCFDSSDATQIVQELGAQIWEEIPPEHPLLSHLALMLSGKPGSYKLLSIVSWCSSLVHQFSLWFSSNSALCRLIMFILIKLLFIKLLHPSIPPLCLCVQLCWCLCISRTHPRFPPFGFHTPFFVITHLPLVTLLKLLFKDVS